MELVFLLVDESKYENENGTFNVTRDFYEMPVYKKKYTEQELEAFLKEELGDTVEIQFVGDTGVCFELRGRDEYFKFNKAIKFGDEYFKLETLKRNSLENECGNEISL